MNPPDFSNTLRYKQPTRIGPNVRITNMCSETASLSRDRPAGDVRNTNIAAFTP